MGFSLTPQHSPNSGWAIGIGLAGFGKTIGRRIPICRCDDESERCKVSGPRAPPRNSSQPTPLFTTPSTSNGISSAAKHFANSVQPPSLRGWRQLLRPELMGKGEVWPEGLNLTAPSEQHAGHGARRISVQRLL